MRPQAQAPRRWNLQIGWGLTATRLVDHHPKVRPWPVLHPARHVITVVWAERIWNDAKTANTHRIMHWTFAMASTCLTATRSAQHQVTHRKTSAEPAEAEASSTGAEKLTGKLSSERRLASSPSIDKDCTLSSTHLNAHRQSSSQLTSNAPLIFAVCACADADPLQVQTRIVASIIVTKHSSPMRHELQVVSKEATAQGAERQQRPLPYPLSHRGQQRCRFRRIILVQRKHQDMGDLLIDGVRHSPAVQPDLETIEQWTVNQGERTGQTSNIQSQHTLSDCVDQPRWHKRFCT